MKGMEYYFLTTNHTEKRIWFKDDDDFKVGMNILAVTSTCIDVKFLAFVLMSNHLHIVVRGERNSAIKLIDDFKHRYGSYYQKKYGTKAPLRYIPTDCRSVSSSNEELHRVIAYILMNPVAANICLDASYYKWSSASCYFRGSGQKGKRVSGFSKRQLRAMLHSHLVPPGDMIVSDEGYILPSSYVDVQFVESLYWTPKTMLMFLRSSSKAKAVLEATGYSTPGFSDQIVLGVAKDICKTLFRKNTVKELEPEELSRLIYELRRRLSCDVVQIARVLELDRHVVADALD